ncbi:flagellar basal body L-ring protein FlgH [Caulobacter sp. S45]|uniref:flagellar basal body L-ring protein FlgH n=1 Tax=Caulobacter sp. S45 TaxID=1641861 RepID=UPI00131D68A2|nr:flagellar basal body L-ring protein FlgH [Caulobacter sp. S45]
MSSRRTLLFAVAALAPLAACTAMKNATGTPDMSPITYPAALVPKAQEVLGSHDDSPRPASANSLWRNGARTFFHDQRASKVGDILTINVTIADNAQLSNETTANRADTAQVGFSNLFGLETLLAHAIPGLSTSNLVNTNSTLTHDGKGTVQRSENLTMTIAAVVTGVLPNGNLTIQGRQEVRVNNELRELTVAGIVRPEDISSGNTINHTQIAEARVSYGGKGQITQVQKTPAGQALVAQYSPF